MRGSIEVSGTDSSDELRDLASWLRLEDELRGRVQMSERRIESGHMGGLLDAVSVAVGSGGLAVTFVRSLFTWLGTRKSSARTQVTLHAEDGRQVVLDLPEAADVETVLRQVTQFFEAGGN